MRSGSRAPDRQQSSLRLGCGDAGQRPDLGVGELAALQRPGQEGQSPERAGYPYPLPGRARIQTDPPREPVGARAEADVPTSPIIELSDECEEPHDGRIDMRGELGDLVTETLEFGNVRMSGLHGRREHGHDVPPS